MKIYLTISAILIFFIYQSNAQTRTLPVADLDTAIRLKDAIVENFNKGEYELIYALSGKSFRLEVQQEAFVDFLKNQIAPFGKITLSEIIEDLGEVKYFRIEFEIADGREKQSLKMALGAASAKEFYVFGFSRILSVKDKNDFLSDNPLKNPVDFVVDKAAQSYMQNRNAAGLSIGVIKGGELYAYNYGEAEKGAGKLPKADSFYEIGSITKTFTGILLAQAVLDKKVKLGDDIRKYLDEKFPNLQFEGVPVTLKDLSTHTSGIPSTTDNVKDTGYVNPWENFSRAKLFDALHRVKLDRKPGEKFEYSNTAVGLLGNILEKVYGMSYENLVEKYIAKPAGMKETKINLSGTEVRRLVMGYNNRGETIPFWNVRGIEAAGALRSTVIDMLKYLKFNLEAKNKAARLAQQTHWQSPLLPAQIGLGWEIRTTASGYRRLAHSGGTGGFRSYCAFYPELNLGIVVLTNNGDIDPVRVVDEIYFRMTR
jgi:CubicO group peptidase (beta-lactamase class C family)